MNLGPLVLLFALSKLGHEHAPRWPGKRHPPPRHPRAHKHHAHHAHHHAPAHHVHEAPVAHEVHHEVHHAVPHVVHHAPQHHFVDLNAPHGAPTAEPQPLSEVHAAPPAPAPVDATPVAPPTPAPTDVGYPIAQLQRILVGLGWTGHLTMQGPVSAQLRDGLYGPVTHDDWQHSAQRRNLDPTFVRLGPQTAHVDPSTYATLRQLALGRGAVVGVGGRLIRIPR